MDNPEEEILSPSVHERKNWKEYFLDFVMMFLAVALGFFADNIRESLADREKEKQYIEGFIRNLKDDTANLTHVIESNRRMAMGLDSLLMISHSNMAIYSNRRSFYYYVIKYCYNESSFKSNDATLEQLKSTGDYRLIEKDHVADSLSKYDIDMRNIYKQGEYYEGYFKEIISRLDELANVTVLGDTSFIKNGKMGDRPFPQLRVENGKLTTFFNKVYVFKIITNAYVENNLVPQLENSKRLSEFLRNQYDIQE
jgi:hypothetical protein